MSKDFIEKHALKLVLFISEYPSALPVLIILVFLTIILMITIIYAIQNPILRAFLSVFIIGQSVIYMIMND